MIIEFIINCVFSMIAIIVIVTIVILMFGGKKPGRFM